MRFAAQAEDAGVGELILEDSGHLESIGRIHELCEDWDLPASDEIENEPVIDRAAPSNGPTVSLRLHQGRI